MAKPTRWLLGTVAAAATTLALAPAAQATTATKHHVLTYKVEKHLTLSEGSSISTPLSCKAGDIATDGMWRVDHVAPFNAQLADPGEVPWDETAVVVTESRSTAVGTFAFTLTNTTSEDAQAKLFLVCLGGKTAADTHQHAISTTAAPAAGAGPGGPGKYEDASLQCANGEVFIAPGFRITAGTAETFRSSPTNTLRGWNFGFWITAPNSALTISGRCLSLTTGTTVGHRHTLYASLRHDPTEHFDRGNGITEHQISCEDDAKGLVGGYDLYHPSFDWNHFSWHWLGMDPRPKTRAYRTLGTGGAGDYTLVCFKDRTSRPKS